MIVQPGCGWSSLVPVLVDESIDSILAALHSFVPDAGAEQHAAWTESLDVLRREGAIALGLSPAIREQGAVLEYELPREGGRRPDVLILQNGVVTVLEFKSAPRPRREDLDQVAAYARDLRCYHSACDAIEVVPILVLPSGNVRLVIDGIHVVGAAALGSLLVGLGTKAGHSPIALQTFLEGEYAPLPSLVAAARLLFERRELPFIRRARSAGVPETVERVIEIAHTAATRRERRLVLVTGVPGAGKTLVGLQVAHSQALDEIRLSRRGAPATFLSGNGPLVQVLQHALSDKTFVRDMHRFIREHGLLHPGRIPDEHLFIFDEAQRAWDGPKLEDFYRKKLLGKVLGDLPDLQRSEPQLLVEIANRVPGWSVVLALVGSGQEIHVGEEAGIAQWADAVRGQDWIVHGPPALAHLFDGIEYQPHGRLSLDTTLRSHAAADFHEWVASFLDGDAVGARRHSLALRDAAFPIYLTRSLEAAKQYARRRFAGESLRRFGLLASSRADRFLARFGIDCGFQATKQLKIGAWFNDPPDRPLSCCQLSHTVTEFQSQGLELDLPIVAWGDDLRRVSGQWTMRKPRPNPLVHNPLQLRVNAYRVLLTRGREGLVIYVPEEPLLDETAQFLSESGVLLMGEELLISARTAQG